MLFAHIMQLTKQKQTKKKRLILKLTLANKFCFYKIF